jgi:PhnB protein
MSNLAAYLTFDGTCAEAMRFYEKTLGGKLEFMQTFGESPMPCPDAMKDRVMHARLVVDGGVLMASDAMGGHPYEGMKGFSISLQSPTLESARKLFDALAEGGKVTMPLEKTFWAEGFGMLVDRFGTPWMVNVDHPKT